MKGITWYWQRIIKVAKTNFLDFTDTLKLTVLLVLICAFLMQSLFYVQVLLWWDNAYTVVYINHVIELQHAILIMYGVCLILAFGLYVIYKIKSAFLLAYYKYLFTVTVAIILFMLGAYFGFINLASGVMGASIPLFAMLAFERRLAFFFIILASCGFISLGYLVRPEQPTIH